MAITHFEQLEVWQEAMNLVELTYRYSCHFPREEQFGLTSQIRRAAVSVPSNIAEGHGRKGTKEYLRHLSIARGSLMEVLTQAEIARRLQYSPTELHQTLNAKANVVGRLLNGLIRALENKT